MSDVINVILKVLAGIYVIGKAIAQWWKRNRMLIEAVVKRLEVYAVDGIIDMEERKKLAVEALKILEDKGKLQLNWFQRKIVYFLIDKIARRLPDIEIEHDAMEAVQECWAVKKGNKR